MSGTVDVPAGLDKMTPDEHRIMDSMRADDDGGAAPEAKEPAQKQAPKAAPDVEPAAPAPEFDDEGTPVEQKQATVPHAQFHAMNERRKVAEAKAAKAESEAAVERAKLTERFNALAAAIQASATPERAAAAEELPDVNVDPVGHFSAEAKQLRQKIADMEAMQRGFQEQGEQQRQAGELRNWGASQEREFMAREPSYNEAMQFLTTSRNKELESIGVTDPAVRQQIIGQDVGQIAARSRQEGANFAERLYGLAQARGFAKTAAIPAIDDGAATRSRAAHDAATTIGSVGAAPPTRLSPEKIANMSDRDFGVLMDKMKGNPQAMRQLLGD